MFSSQPLIFVFLCFRNKNLCSSVKFKSQARFWYIFHHFHLEISPLHKKREKRNLLNLGIPRKCNSTFERVCWRVHCCEVLPFWLAFYFVNVIVIHRINVTLRTFAKVDSHFINYCQCLAHVVCWRVVRVLHRINQPFAFKNY